MQLRLKELERCRAIFIDTRAGSDPFLECLLNDRGIVIVGRYGSIAEIATLRALPEADLLIAYLPAFSEASVKGLKLASETFGGPVMLMTEADDAATVREMMNAGAHSVVCTAASSDRLRLAAASAVATHEQMRHLTQRAECAERALEERKFVERAKGILMQQQGISEHEALRELQRKSMQRNETLPMVARTIIAAKELLG